MGLRNVRRFSFGGGAALVREMAEVPKYLVEEFARELFRLGPQSTVYPSQLEHTIGEISSGNADFIGWLIRTHPDDIPDSMAFLADMLQRTSAPVPEKMMRLVQRSQDPEGEDVEADVPKELLEEFARVCLGLPQETQVDAAQLLEVVAGISDGRYDFLAWLDAHGLTGEMQEVAGG